MDHLLGMAVHFSRLVRECPAYVLQAGSVELLPGVAGRNDPSLSFDEWNFSLALTCCSFILLGIVAEIALGTFVPLVDGYRFTGTTHPNTQAATELSLYSLAAITWARAGAGVFGQQCF